METLSLYLGVTYVIGIGLRIGNPKEITILHILFSPVIVPLCIGGVLGILLGRIGQKEKEEENQEK